MLKTKRTSISYCWVNIYKSELRVYISELRVYMSELRVYISELRVYMSELRVYMSELRVYISELREKSHNYLVLFFIQWRKRASICCSLVLLSHLPDAQRFEKHYRLQVNFGTAAYEIPNYAKL